MKPGPDDLSFLTTTGPAVCSSIGFFLGLVFRLKFHVNDLFGKSGSPPTLD